VGGVGVAVHATYEEGRHFYPICMHGGTSETNAIKSSLLGFYRNQLGNRGRRGEVQQPPFHLREDNIRIEHCMS
jgi:hypothetical protein